MADKLSLEDFNSAPDPTEDQLGSVIPSEDGVTDINIPYNKNRPMTGEVNQGLKDPGFGEGQTNADVTATDNPYFDPATDTKLTPEQFYASPLESLSLEQAKKIDRIGQGPDNRPVLDYQNIDPILRWKTQLLFDNADEKAQFLKKELPDYKFALDPLDKTNIILKRKGTRYWGRVDPSFAQDNIASEIAENIDSVAQALAIPAVPLKAALQAGGIEAVRQLAKTYVSDQDPSLTSVAINAGAGAVGTAVLSKLGNDVGAGKDAVLNAGRTVKETEAAAGAASKIKSAAKFFETPEYVLQNLGADAADFSRNLETNISYLFANSPEAKAAIQEPFTLKGKQKAVDAVLKKTGEALDSFYSNPQPIVKVGDILSSEQSQLLDQAVSQGRVLKNLKTVIVDETTKKKAAVVQRDLLTRLASVVLPEKSAALIAFKKGRLLDVYPELKKMGITSENQAMAALLADRSLTPAEARAIHDGFVSKLNFNKKSGQIKELDTIQKYALDSLSDGIQKAADATGDVTLATNNRLFHELAPISNVIDRSVDKAKAQSFNFTKFVPGAINGIRRQSLMIATKLAARPEVRAGLNKLGSGEFPFPGVDLKAPSAQKLMAKAMRGASFLEAKALGKKQFLPRDSEVYFSDPGALNELVNQAGDPELTDAMVRQVDRGDKEGFANTLSMVTAGNPDAFDPAPYPSLVMKDGKPVIQDKYDREQYRQWVEKNVLDAGDRYRILKELNFTNIMLRPPFEIPQQLDNAKKARKSGISRVADNLKKSDTVTQDDGSERQGYDY